MNGTEKRARADNHWVDNSPPKGSGHTVHFGWIPLNDRVEQCGSGEGCSAIRWRREYLETLAPPCTQAQLQRELLATLGVAT